MNLDHIPDLDDIRKNRAPFTPEEDDLLLALVKREVSYGFKPDGNQLYLRIGSMFKNRTYVSLKARYLRVLLPKLVSGEISSSTIDTKNLAKSPPYNKPDASIENQSTISNSRCPPMLAQNLVPVLHQEHMMQSPNQKYPFSGKTLHTNPEIPSENINRSISNESKKVPEDLTSNAKGTQMNIAYPNTPNNMNMKKHTLLVSNPLTENKRSPIQGKDMSTHKYVIIRQPLTKISRTVIDATLSDDYIPNNIQTSNTDELDTTPTSKRIRTEEPLKDTLKESYTQVSSNLHSSIQKSSSVIVDHTKKVFSETPETISKLAENPVYLESLLDELYTCPPASLLDRESNSRMNQISDPNLNAWFELSDDVPIVSNEPNADIQNVPTSKPIAAVINGQPSKAATSIEVPVNKGVSTSSIKPSKGAMHVEVSANKEVPAPPMKPSKGSGSIETVSTPPAHPSKANFEDPVSQTTSSPSIKPSKVATSSEVPVNQALSSPPAKPSKDEKNIDIPVRKEASAPPAKRSKLETSVDVPVHKEVSAHSIKPSKGAVNTEVPVNPTTPTLSIKLSKSIVNTEVPVNQTTSSPSLKPSKIVRSNEGPVNQTVSSAPIKKHSAPAVFIGEKDKPDKVEGRAKDPSVPRPRDVRDVSALSSKYDSLKPEERVPLTSSTSSSVSNAISSHPLNKEFSLATIHTVEMYLASLPVSKLPVYRKEFEIFLKTIFDLTSLTASFIIFLLYQSAGDFNLFRKLLLAYLTKPSILSGFDWWTSSSDYLLTALDNQGLLAVTNPFKPLIFFNTPNYLYSRYLWLKAGSAPIHQ